MSWLSGYRFRKLVSIAAQAGAGTDYQVPLEVHSGKWVSPTGFSDPDTEWSSETLIYDDNTGTAGYTFTHNHYVELTLDSAINLDTVRIYGYAIDTTDLSFPDIDVAIDLFYDADWHNIFTGTITKDTWVEKTNSAGVKSVTKARIKSTNADYRTYIYEFEFEARAGAGVAWLWDYCTDFPNDIRFTDDDGSTELDHWLEKSTDDPAKFWIEVTDDLDDAQNYYIYWGKSGASTASNGTNTFIVFDDFERGNNGDAIGGDWTIEEGDVDISTEQAYAGTRSMKLIGDNTNLPQVSIPVTNGAVAIRFRGYKEDASKMSFRHGDGTNYMLFRGNTDEDIDYYDGAWKDTTSDMTADAWKLFEVRNFVWGAPSYDIIYEGSNVSDDTDMVTAALYTDVGWLGGIRTTGADSWIDNFLVRKYIEPEPVVGTPGALEVNPVIIMHHYKMLRAR